MFNIENVKISEKWLFCDFNIYNLGWVIRKNSYLKVISITFLDHQEDIKYLWSSDLTKIEHYRWHKNLNKFSTFICSNFEIWIFLGKCTPFINILNKFINIFGNIEDIGTKKYSQELTLFNWRTFRIIRTYLEEFDVRKDEMRKGKCKNFDISNKYWQKTIFSYEWEPWFKELEWTIEQDFILTLDLTFWNILIH